MRIATLGNASVVHTTRWVEHFRARGHEVRLFSLEPAPAGFPGVVPLPTSGLPGALRYPLAVPALARELRAFAPDLIDAHFVPNYGLMGRLVAGSRPLSIAAWGSDLLLGAHGVARLRARFALERAQLVLCDADNLATAAHAAGARPETVRALPWGVDRARFRAREPRMSGLILSVRMHEPVYDMPTVIQAAARVMAESPHTTLVIAGDGSQRAALESLAARTLPAGRWRFVGRVSPDEMAEWLARAEVVISASLSDSTSQSLLEAMASGTVPVVSDIPGNREWVAEGDGARLFAPGDAEGCARAVLAALGDPAWCERTRERNARVIEARGDWHVNLARIESWFAALAAGRPLPAWPDTERA